MLAPATLLHQLKSVDWTNAEASLWTIAFDGSGENAPQIINAVKCSPQLLPELRNIVINQIRGAESVRPFDHLNADLEEGETLAVKGNNDVLGAVAGKLNPIDVTNGDVSYITAIEELYSAAGYVVRLDAATDEIVFGFKKMPENLRTSRRFLNTLVNRNVELLPSEDERKVFRLSRSLDAFHFSGVSFVLNKRSFEIALRYREGMKNAADKAIAAIKDAGIISNPEALSKRSYMHLRRLAGIAKDPKFNNPQWLSAVRKLNETYKWNLRFTEDGKLVLDEEFESTILSLLRDRRALTLINNEMIDAEVARPVT